MLIKDVYLYHRGARNMTPAVRVLPAAHYWVTQLCDQSQPQIVDAKAGLGVLLTRSLEAQMNRLFTVTEMQFTL